MNIKNTLYSFYIHFIFMEQSLYLNKPRINYSYKINVDYIVNNVKHNCIIKMSTSPLSDWSIYPHVSYQTIIKHHGLHFEKEFSKEQISKLISNKYIYKSHTIQTSYYCNICLRNICSKKYFHKICRPCFNKCIDNKKLQCYKCNNLFIICDCGCPASECNYCVGGCDSLYCSQCI